MKRIIRRKIRGIFFGIAGFIFALIIFYALFLTFRLTGNLIKQTGSQKNSDLIRPIGLNVSRQEIEKKLSEKKIKIDPSFSASESGFIVLKLLDGPKVYFSQSKDADWQIASLQIILSKLTIDNKKPESLDLRLSKPIVKF